MEVLIGKTSKDQIIFQVDGYLYMIDKKIQNIDCVKYYCHCSLQCGSRAIITKFDDYFSAKITKIHTNHSPEVEKWIEVKF